MARIVLGVGSSHSPLLTFSADMWLERAADDRRNDALTLSDGRTLGYDALLAERGPAYADGSREIVLVQQAERTQAALDRLAEAIRDVDPDVILIIGDDQEELYKAGNTPALAIWYGDELVMRPLGEIVREPPAWMTTAIGGYAMETDNRFSCDSAFALELIERLMDAGVDLAVASTIADPKVAGFGHAYGFILKRLVRNAKIPVVPILLNTYYPPNVIRPRRCFEIGRQIAVAVDDMPSNARVVVIASGGMSHFVTDEALDGQVLEALKSGDVDKATDIPMAALRAGSSEILCWIMAGGAFHHLDHRWSDYIPVYRTPAGTGIGLAFGMWA
jgi:hypothetical protein